MHHEYCKYNFIITFCGIFKCHHVLRFQKVFDESRSSCDVVFGDQYLQRHHLGRVLAHQFRNESNQFLISDRNLFGDFFCLIFQSNPIIKPFLKITDKNQFFVLVSFNNFNIFANR